MKAAERRSWLSALGLAAAFGLAVVTGCSEKPKAPPEAGTEPKTTTGVAGASSAGAPKAAANPREVADRAVKFILGHQNADGGFGTFKGRPASSVGVTGLVVRALLDSPAKLTEANTPAIGKAIQYITSRQRADGAISEGELDNYHTSLAVIALVATGNPAYKDVLGKAEGFLRGIQLDETEGYTEDYPFYGGAGYSSNPKVSDMSNTGFWIEAMHELGVETDDPAMQKALIFVDRVTNNPEVNDQPWAKEVTPENYGGAVYRPAADPERKDVDISKAGRDRTGWRSYGSMTYHAFKSFIYGGCDDADPAVEGALKWIENNYTLDENPGSGTEGQYYYYRVFARALGAWGKPEVAGHKWAADLAAKLAELQQADGSWVNTDKERWMESDPVLVTGYCLEALSIAIDGMKSEG